MGHSLTVMKEEWTSRWFEVFGRAITDAGCCLVGREVLVRQDFHLGVFLCQAMRRSRRKGAGHLSTEQHLIGR